jgi:hypothetical protein
MITEPEKGKKQRGLPRELPVPFMAIGQEFFGKK